MYPKGLCIPWVCTTSEIYIRHKKIGIGSILCIYADKRFERCFDSSEPPYKRTPKSRMTIVKVIHFISQHKAHIDPCTLSSQKLVVFILICGSSIASKASNWATEVNFESPLLPLCLLYISGLDGPDISLLFLKREDNKIILNAWRPHLVGYCFAKKNRHRLINMHRTQCARFLCDEFLGLRIRKNAC